MKLVVRQIEPGQWSSPYCLHTEDGQQLPGQAELRIEQLPDDVCKLTVVFHVDGDLVRLGDSKDD